MIDYGPEDPNLYMIAGAVLLFIAGLAGVMYETEVRCHYTADELQQKANRVADIVKEQGSLRLTDAVIMSVGRSAGGDRYCMEKAIVTHENLYVTGGCGDWRCSYDLHYTEAGR